MKKRMVSIGVKLIIPIFLCFIIFGASLMVTINLLTRSTSAETFKEGINQKDNLVYQLIDEQTDLLEKKARWFGEFAGEFAGTGGLIAGPEAGNSAALQSQLDALLLALDVDGIALADRNGYLLINSGASGSSDGARYVRTIVSYTEGRDCVTRMYSLDNALELVSAVPVFAGGRLVGYGFIEYSLQSAKFVNALQSLTQCEIDLYQGPVLKGSSVGLPQGETAGLPETRGLSQGNAGGPAPDAGNRKSWITPFTGSLSSDHDLMIDAVLGLGETFRGEYAVGDTTYYGVHIPLKDGSDSRVGIVSMSLPMTTVGQTVQLINRVVLPLLAGGIMLLLAVFILLLRVVVISPLKNTASTAAAVSENLSSREADFTYQMPVKRRDEIAVIIMSINGFIAS
ncbi:MAG: cache domain-containing protein, partial [Spirochaetaceae bacterium]|nr:cache domain-containing protein [Spirochaetaceae bacterium]